MIKKYDKFIIESLLETMILEANIIYKNDFRDVLLSLKKKEVGYDDVVSEIATFLLSIVGLDMDISQNYIGISDETDKISFIPDNKVNFNSVSYRNSQVLRFKSVHQIILDAKIPTEGLILIDEIDTGDIPNDWKLIKTYDMSDVEETIYSDYILYHLQSNIYPDKFIVCYNTKGDISAITPNISKSIVEGKLKIGRYVNRLLDLYFKDKEGKVAIGDYSYKRYKDRKDYKVSDIEKFVNAFISSAEFIKNAFDYFDVVKGEEIKKWYLHIFYVNDSGELGQSCMKYDRCQEYFDIYIENPDVCSLLILKDPVDNGLSWTSSIHGRALLWILDDGTKYMDRVYTNRNGLDGLFEKWGDENGYKSKYANDSTKKSVNVVVKNYDKYPYMDTFKFYYSEAGILSSTPDDSDKEVMRLVDTNGGYN
jgi:hypothetical protein